jgi:hypothetical protein
VVVRGRWYFVSIGAVVVAAPLVAWWLIGPLREGNLPADDLDYIVRAPEVPGWLVSTIGFVSLFVAPAAILNLARRENRVRNRLWLRVVVPLVIAGVLLAGSGRLITAGSHGANIGGGFAELVGLPVVVILVGIAIGRAVHAVRCEGAEKSAETSATRPNGFVS